MCKKRQQRASSPAGLLRRGGDSCCLPLGTRGRVTPSWGPAPWGEGAPFSGSHIPWLSLLCWSLRGGPELGP